MPTIPLLAIDVHELWRYGYLRGLVPMELAVSMLERKLGI